MERESRINKFRIYKIQFLQTFGAFHVEFWSCKLWNWLTFDTQRFVVWVSTTRERCFFLHRLQLQGFGSANQIGCFPAEEEAPPISSVLIVWWRVTLQRHHWSTLPCTKQPPLVAVCRNSAAAIEGMIGLECRKKNEEHDIPALSSWRWLRIYLYMDIYSKLPE